MKNPLLKTVLLVLVLFIIINNFLFYPGNILCWDVFGYYLYLPLKFIYHDLGVNDESIITRILEEYQNSATFYQGVRQPDGGYVMKYTMGLSILYAPFFFAGHLVAKLSHYTADGFSAPYQFSILIGGIIYSLMGILILSKVLMRFFNERITSVVLVIIVFATNYMIHITMSGQNANSHNHLFLAYGLILWLTILWHDSRRLKWAIFLALTCGIAILARPSEVVCLVIPVFWGVTGWQSFRDKVRLFLGHYQQVILFVVILVIIGSFQFIYWKIHAGKFFYNSYGGNAGEGFQFLHPYILKVLFSFRKGWLIYTPVMIFAIAGFVLLYKKNRPLFLPLFIYFVLNIYFVSNWSTWWYAQSFSQRALIPSYPVMAITLGYFLVWLSERKAVLKTAGVVLICLLIFLNIFQTIQYANGTIHGDRMTREYYFAVFGKRHATEEDRRLLLVSRSFESTEVFSDTSGYNSRPFASQDFEEIGMGDSTRAYSGRCSFRLDSNIIFTPPIEVSYKTLTEKDHAWIRVKAAVYPLEDASENPFRLVVHFTYNGYPYKYRALDSENMELEPGRWNRISFDYLTPEVRRKSDLLRVYFWNRGNGTIHVDDLQIKIFEKSSP